MIIFQVCLFVCAVQRVAQANVSCKRLTVNTYGYYQSLLTNWLDNFSKFGLPINVIFKISTWNFYLFGFRRHIDRLRFPSDVSVCPKSNRSVIQLTNIVIEDHNIIAGLAVVNFMQKSGAIFEYPHNNCDSFL